MNQYTSGWSPEEIATLIRLNGEGLNAVEIGKMMGRSKYSVNNKRGVLGLRAPPTPKKVRAPRPMRAKSPHAPILSAPSAPAAVVEFPVRGLIIADREFGGCRWPVGGQGAQTRFCCRPKARGSFCAEHAERGYQPKKQQTEAQREEERSIRRALRRA